MNVSLPEDLARHLCLLGRKALRVERIPTRCGSQDKLCLRLCLDNGSTVKARWLATEEHAVNWNRLRGLVGKQPFLSDRLSHDGSMVLEDWVTGNTLPMENSSAEQLNKAGEVLARIHELPIPGRGITTSDLEVQRIVDLLGSLVSQHALSRIEADALEHKVKHSSPQSTFRGLIHYDFCGENLVQSTSRGIVSIDHEWMCLSSLEFDLARAIYRWNLTGQSRASFLDGYRLAGGQANCEALDWWLFANEVFAAVIRWRRGWPDAAATVRHLRRRLHAD